MAISMIMIFLGELGTRNDGLIEGDQKAYYTLQAKTFFEYLILGFSMILVIVPEGIWLTLFFATTRTLSNLLKDNVLMKTLEVKQITDVLVSKETLVTNQAVVDRIHAARDFYFGG